MSSRRSLQQTAFLACVALLTLHPWILTGLRGPDSDAPLLLMAAAAKYGLTTVDWTYLLFTAGPGLFLAPLLWIWKSSLFYWIASGILAGVTVLTTLGMWKVFRRLLQSPWAVGLATILVACHPLLHQLHYQWMTEWLYITALFFGLYSLALFLNEGQKRDVIWAGLWTAVAMLMRPQASLLQMVGSVVILGRGFLPEPWCQRWQKSLGQAMLFFLIPYLVTAPWRVLNHVHHGTWALNKTMGYNVIYNLKYTGTFSPTNGPASRQLQEWYETIQREGLAHLPAAQEPWAKGRVDSIPKELDNMVAGRPFNDAIPLLVCYLFQRDWQKADDFSVQVVWEAMRTHPKAYLKYAAFTRWYFTGLSENPDEWHASYRKEYLPALATREYVMVLNEGEVRAKGWGGLTFHYPALMGAYDVFRNAFARGMTLAKKATFWTLPLLLWLSWPRRDSLWRWFTSLAVMIHLLTGIALGVIVNYHHRYNAPLDFFTFFYLACWIDLGIAYVRNRRAL